MPLSRSESSSVTVRPARDRDLPALVALNHLVQGLHADALPAIFKAPSWDPTAVFFAEALRRVGMVAFVAEVDQQVVGYVLAEETHRREGTFTFAAHDLYVHHIAVDGDHRRLGVGKLLLEAADGWARSQGLAGVGLDHWAFNDRAHEFFASLGFVVENVRMRRPVSDPDREEFGTT